MRVSIIFLFLRLMLVVEARADDPLLLSSQFAAIEQQIGGRLGVAALDIGNGRRIEYRAAERFPICSTFKLILAAAILEQGDREPLDRRLYYGPDDLLEWAPITKKHQKLQFLLGRLANMRCGTFVRTPFLAAVSHWPISTHQHSRAHEGRESIFDALFHIRFESTWFDGVSLLRIRDARFCECNHLGR